MPHREAPCLHSFASLGAADHLYVSHVFIVCTRNVCPCRCYQQSRQQALLRSTLNSQVPSAKCQAQKPSALQEPTLLEEAHDAGLESVSVHSQGRAAALRLRPPFACRALVQPLP